MIKQDQSVTDGSQALQAGGNITIGQHLSAEQMMELMVAMAGQLSAFTQEAQRTFDERLSTFRRDLIARFADTSRAARKEAFNEPDFQFVLRDAQEAFARSGDQELGEILVEAVAERSKETNRSRLLLTLNAAIGVAPKLTKEEFSALGLSVSLRFCTGSPTNLEDFYSFISSKLMPFVEDVDYSNYSIFLHLQTLSCATWGVGETTISSIFRRSYAALLSRGFTSKDLVDTGYDEAYFVSVLMPCLHDAQKLQLNTLDKATFDDIVRRNELDAGKANGLWGLFESTLVPEAQIQGFLSPKVPGIEKLFNAWDGSALKNLTISLLGIAVGHAYARKKVDLQMTLSAMIR